MKEKTTTKLRPGDKIFYYDGLNLWDIETVETVDKEAKTATLSNNAVISRYPNPDGTFSRVGTNLPKRNTVIKVATPELEKLRTSILCKRRIEGIIFQLKNDILKKADTHDWQRWSEAQQNRLINVAGHLLKAIQEVSLDPEEKELVEQLKTDKKK